jgi:superfamily II DNA or RNA helicase
MNSFQLEELQLQLKRALDECERLKKENKRLMGLLSLRENNNAILENKSEPPLIRVTENSIIVNARSSTDQKVSLFRSLFQGRTDVYPIRWESKNGKSRYSPACANEWNRTICMKPKIKCAECNYREFLPVEDTVIFDHLDGKITIGVYPLLFDETCLFLAVDFDKSTWKEDSKAFIETCRELNIPASLERSRSGNGGHVWIFFESPIEASLARSLGTAILSRTMEKRHQIGFDSFDRMFPNQDTMPKGGFGNLIALPLQGKSKANGNCVFLDDNFEPYKDQWLHLSSIQKMTKDKVESIIPDLNYHSGLLSLDKIAFEDIENEKPWVLGLNQGNKNNVIEGPYPSRVKLVQSNLLYIEKQGLSSALLYKLISLAAFPNPEFFKAQAMRLPTYGKPRIISCADDFKKYIGLPRGCRDEVEELFHTHKAIIEWDDQCSHGKKIEVNFTGELNEIQTQAVHELLKHDQGILSATTAFGKTVVGSWMIAKRKVNTLILVHRRQLMDQWKERLASFLDISPKLIGQIGGGKNKTTGIIDIGVIQSLNHKGVVKELVEEYGQIIVDECHHVSAFSFEQVMKKAKAKYVLGLTATPVRKDGHHPIVMMQCGPIRYQVDAKSQAAIRPFDNIVIPRYTNFSVPSDEPKLTIQEIYTLIAEDELRNDLIFDDLLQALEAGSSPVLLTERTSHVEYFSERLKGFAKNVIVLRGGMGKKHRKALAEQIAGIPEEEERVLIATGRYIGEGFDDSRLDTLFLAMPISWKGTLQQYVGRLHRLHHNKKVVQVYDYVDLDVPMLKRMYDKRITGYNALGYQVRDKSSKTNGIKSIQGVLF